MALSNWIGAGGVRSPIVRVVVACGPSAAAPAGTLRARSANSVPSARVSLVSVIWKVAALAAGSNITVPSAGEKSTPASALPPSAFQLTASIVPRPPSRRTVSVTVWPSSPE